MGAYSKQVILVRKDLKLSKGKMSAQVAHASAGAFFEAIGYSYEALKEHDGVFPMNVGCDSALHHWLNESFTKVVLEVADEAELLKFYEEAKANGLPTTLNN